MPLQRNGVERYLADELSPLVGDSWPDVSRDRGQPALVTADSSPRELVGFALRNEGNRREHG